MDKKDKDYPPASGILPQYAHLKGMSENMRVIRKLLGLSEYGRIPTDTAIGRALQRFVENDSQNAVRESRININPPLEQ
jgi:hypothetical protein